MSSISHNGDSISYTYDPDGIRTSKTVNGTTTKYHVMNGTLLGQTKGSDTIVFLYDEKANRYGFDYNGTKYYYIFNVQGDVIGILNQAGQKIVSYTYDPWGKLLSIGGPQAGTIGQLNPIRYRSYYYDTETGFYYLQSRYYDPTVRRFLNADTLILFDKKADLFSYCKNSPVNSIDPTGQTVLSIGLSGNATAIWGIGVSIQIVTDFNTWGIQWSHSGDNITETPYGGILDVGVGAALGIYWGADTIYDMEGYATSFGASGGPGWYVGADAIWLPDSENIFDGIQITAGGGAGVDIHSTQNQTHTIWASAPNTKSLASAVVTAVKPAVPISPVRPPHNPSMNRDYAVYKMYDSLYYKEHYGW